MNHNQQYVPVDRTVATDHLPFFERADKDNDSDNDRSVVPGTFAYTVNYGELFVLSREPIVAASTLYEHFDHAGVDTEGQIWGFNNGDVF